MAASNLVVKLLLESGAFDKNIKTAKASIEGFEKVGKNIVGTFGKVAGVLGIATTAYEVLQTAINSTVNGTKLFQTTLDVAKTSVDNFFYALSTGNFSTFRMGMDVVIAKAREAKEALLDVQYSQMAGSYKVSELRGEYDTYAQKAKDPRLSTEERQQYANKQEEIIVKLEDYTNSQIKMLVEAVLQTASKDTLFSSDNVSLQLIEELLTKVALQGISGVLNEYSPKIQEYENIIEQLGGIKFTTEEWENFKRKLVQYTTGPVGALGYDIGEQVSGGTEVGRWGKAIDNFFYDLFASKKISEGQLKSINKITQEYLPYVLGESLLNNKSSEELQTLIGFMQQIGALKSQLAQWKQGTNENASLFTATPNGSGGGTTTTYLPDSVLGLKQAISDAEKVRDQIDAVADPFGFIAANLEVERLKKRLEQVLALLPSDGKLDLPDFSDESWYEPMDFEIIPVDEKTTENLFSYSEALNSVASAMASISNVTSEGASAWLTWMANVITACAAASDAIKQVVAAKAAEAAANAGAEATKTGPWGFLLAAGAIATVLAAFASIPKFADGGIVNSPFTSGDKVLARVNGGEMILNKHQQSNLFNLLDGGATTSGSRQVEFKISGKELVGVLNNYNNKMSKLR